MPAYTRNEIIRNTILLFNQYGPMVSMSKISEAAGVAAGTPFRYFSTKEELLAAAYKEAHENTLRCTPQESIEGMDAEQAVMADGGSSIRRVAVLGGAGDDAVQAARDAGADAFVTGELKYHTLSDAHLCDMTLLALGHYETEQPVCQNLYDTLRALLPEAEIEIYHANTLYRL